MKLHVELVQDKLGNARVGVPVTVFLADSQVRPVLYQTDDPDGPTLANPVTTDDSGYAKFRVVDGIYDLVVGSGDDVVTYRQVQIYDIEALKSTTQEMTNEAVANQIGPAIDAATGVINAAKNDAATSATEAAESATDANTAKEGAETAAEATDADATQTAADRVQTGADRSAVADDKAAVEAMLGQVQIGQTAYDLYFYDDARSYVPQGAVVGAVSEGDITGGSGGEDGTFPLAFTGGNFTVNPTGTFMVAGGIVTAVTIDGPGLYLGNAPEVPTLDFSASDDLTGASTTMTTEYLVPAGKSYVTPNADDDQRAALYRNNANAAELVQADFGPMDTALAKAWATSDTEPDPTNYPGEQSAKTYAGDAADSATAAAAIVPTVAANLDGVAWLDADALALAGRCAGLSWTADLTELARAIKDVRLFGVTAGESYYIGTLSNDTAGNFDRIVVRQESDDAVWLDSGAQPFTGAKSATGLTTRSIASGSKRIEIDIAYGELAATGTIVNSSATTVLAIMPQLANVRRAPISKPALLTSAAKNPAIWAAGCTFDIAGFDKFVIDAEWLGSVDATKRYAIDLVQIEAADPGRRFIYVSEKDASGATLSRVCAYDVTAAKPAMQVEGRIEDCYLKPVQNGFNATIDGTTMTVSSVTTNSALYPGMTFQSNVGNLIVAGTTIVSQDSGTAGGAGAYTISAAHTIGSATSFVATYGFSMSMRVNWSALLAQAAVFTADFSTTTMTVSAVATGSLAVGMWVKPTGGSLKQIIALGTGSGGTGTYTMSGSNTLTGVACTAVSSEGPSGTGSANRWYYNKPIPLTEGEISTDGARRRPGALALPAGEITFQIDGVPCRVRLPADYSATGTPSRLLVFLHGNGQAYNLDPGSTATDYFDARNFAFAATQGQDYVYGDDLTGSPEGWAWGNDDYRRRYLKLVDYLLANFNFHKGVVLLGSSMGGLVMGQWAYEKPFQIAFCLGLGPVPSLAYIFANGGASRQVPIREAFGMAADGSDDADLASFIGGYDWWEMGLLLDSDGETWRKIGFPRTHIYVGDESLAAGSTYVKDFGGPTNYPLIRDRLRAAGSFCALTVVSGLVHNDNGLWTNVIDDAVFERELGV